MSARAEAAARQAEHLAGIEPYLSRPCAAGCGKIIARIPRITRCSECVRERRPSIVLEKAKARRAQRQAARRVIEEKHVGELTELYAALVFAAERLNTSISGLIAAAHACRKTPPKLGGAA